MLQKFSSQDRPSQVAGRSYVTMDADHQTAAATIYTVTAGKVFYLVSLAISCFNSSTTANGRLRLLDNTTVLLPISIPTAGVAALASFVPGSINVVNFQEPLEFTNSVKTDIPTGTVTYSLTIVGYEQ